MIEGITHYTFTASTHQNEEGEAFSEENGFPMASSFTTDLLYSDCVAWNSVLKDFAAFLGQIYGYDIQKSIKVKKGSDFVTLDRV